MIGLEVEPIGTMYIDRFQMLALSISTVRVNALRKPSLNALA